MARRIGDFLVGVVGPISLRVNYGKQVISSRVGRGTMKQTEATKKSAGCFGSASSFASSMHRKNKIPLAEMGDRSTFNRLNRESVAIWNNSRSTEADQYHFSTESFIRLVGFDYNIKSPLIKKVSALPVIGYEAGLLTMAYPKDYQEIKLKFPPKSEQCIIIATVALYDLEKQKTNNILSAQQFIIDKNDPVLNAIELKFEVPGGCLCVVSMFLKYYTVIHEGTLLNTKQFSPAGICGAIITPGSCRADDGKIWRSIKNKTPATLKFVLP